jgi:hypothetical protein
MRHEVLAAQLGTIALAKRGAGKTVNEASVAAGVEQKYKGQQTLKRFRVDIGLIGRGAPLPKAAPISHSKMAISVFHVSKGPTSLRASGRLSLTHHGQLRPVFEVNRAKGVPSL